MKYCGPHKRVRAKAIIAFKNGDMATMITLYCLFNPYTKIRALFILLKIIDPILPPHRIAVITCQTHVLSKQEGKIHHTLESMFASVFQTFFSLQIQLFNFTDTLND